MTSRTKVIGVIEVPFSTTWTTFFPRLERGSFFLAFILAYISWLNLVVISAWKKEDTLLKTKKKEKLKEKFTFLFDLNNAQEGSKPRKLWAKVWGSTRSSKSSIIFTYSVAAWTHSLYLLLSLGRSLIVNAQLKVSDESNWKEKELSKNKQRTMHLALGTSTDEAI